jgi:NF-kappa-B inhibitor-like protein 2
MKAGLYLNLGLVVKEMGDLETAEDHYLSSRKHGCEAGTYGIVCQSLYNLGDILISTRQYNRALVLFEESLRYAEKVKSNANRVESLLKIAMVRVRLMDLDGAKENLKAVLKLGAIDDDEYSVVKRQYRELCKAIKLISQSSLSSSWDEKIKLYDEIGDTCSHPSCKFYEVAIKYYKMELELAEEYGMDKEDVSKIVFSIAETCKDNGDYNESLKYYQKDLELWTGHPEQEAILWTNIARLHESSGSVPEAIQAYDQSFKLARAISAYTTLVAAYQSLITFCDSTPQLASRSHAYQRELDEILQEHPEAIQEPIEEATPIHDSDNESLVLSTSQSEDEEEGVVLVEESSAFLRKTRGVAVCKKSKAAFKKNEKGETPLHLAAIKGNVSRAVQLIEIGADINARDHCGWTPLHEACNHGNVGVVRCLLDGGADINDRGGYDCDSTTALMDAATNGHVSIVTLLIDRGADISIRNSQVCSVYHR